MAELSSLRDLEELRGYTQSNPLSVSQQDAIEELSNRQKAASAAGTVSPFESSFNPFNPNFRATAQNAISNMLGGSNISSNPNYLQGRIANSLSGLVDFIPAVGDAVGVGDTITSYRQGDMLGTGINALATGVGVLPLVGGPASKAVKAGGNRARLALNDLYHGTSIDAAEQIERSGFDLSKSADGSAWFTSNPDIGEVAATGQGGVVRRQLDESNLKLASYAETDKYTNGQLQDMGYDGAYYPDQDGATQYEIWNQDKLNELPTLTIGDTPSVRIDDLDEDQYIQAINPQGTRIKPEARPNLGMGDMYGMASRNAEEIMVQELRSGETIRYVQDGDSVYALGYNPDLGEEDVVGYMLGGGDGSELAVVDQMQGKGIGGNLSYLYRSQNPMAQSGGFTEAGEAAARQAYRRMMGYE